MKVGLLHPGAMGVTVGAALADAGHEVLWLPEGRGSATAGRAGDAGFVGCSSLDELCAGADGIVSVCPPHAALDVARSVVDAGFSGVYVDANAIAPATARALADLVGDSFVDGGIVGPPAIRQGTTRLYLSGSGAPAAAAWFDGGKLGAGVVPGTAGAASALKMCYAAYTKGSSALLLAVRALAESEGVSHSLLAEWELSQPGLAARSEGAASGTAGKAWRFVGEMEEIAATFEARGLPGEFHHAAADVYRRMSGLKDVSDADIAAVIEALLADG